MCSAKPVNGLRRVADRDDTSTQQLHKRHLRWCQILRFVHQTDVVVGPPAVQNGSVHHVVEIARTGVRALGPYGGQQLRIALLVIDLTGRLTGRNLSHNVGHFSTEDFAGIIATLDTVPKLVRNLVSVDSRTRSVAPDESPSGSVECRNVSVTHTHPQFGRNVAVKCAKQNRAIREMTQCGDECAGFSGSGDCVDDQIRRAIANFLQNILLFRRNGRRLEIPVGNIFVHKNTLISESVGFCKKMAERYTCTHAIDEEVCAGTQSFIEMDEEKRLERLAHAMNWMVKSGFQYGSVTLVFLTTRDTMQRSSPFPPDDVDFARTWAKSAVREYGYLSWTFALKLVTYRHTQVRYDGCSYAVRYENADTYDVVHGDPLTDTRTVTLPKALVEIQSCRLADLWYVPSKTHFTGTYAVDLVLQNLQCDNAVVCTPLGVFKMMIGRAVGLDLRGDDWGGSWLILPVESPVRDRRQLERNPEITREHAKKCG